MEKYFARISKPTPQSEQVKQFVLTNKRKVVRAKKQPARVQMKRAIPAQPNNMKKMVYILKDPLWSTNVYKVGGTNNASARLADPSYTTAREKALYYEFVFVAANSSLINETELHRHCKIYAHENASDEMYQIELDILKNHICSYLDSTNMVYDVISRDVCLVVFPRTPMLQTTFNIDVKPNMDKIVEQVISDPKTTNRILLERDYKKLVAQTPFYPNQINAAKALIDLFFNKGLQAITLVLETQYGKTGIVSYLAYLVCKEGFLDPSNVFFLTGMSDTQWQTQTSDRVLDCFKKNVLHRGMSTNKRLSIQNNSLLIIDESQYGTSGTGQLSEKLNENDIYDSLEDLKSRNIKILLTSATPDGLLLDIDDTFGDNHARVTFEPTKDYYGLRNMMQSNVLHHIGDFLKKDWCNTYGKIIENKFEYPKYHCIRLRSSLKDQEREMENLKQLCFTLDWDIKAFDSENKIEDVFSNEPKKHTLILLKNMLRASKTIEKMYIGTMHERKCKKYNNSTVVQGFPGRICGYHPYRNIHIFADINSIKKYISLMYEHNMNYDKAIDYNGTRMIRNMDGKAYGDHTLMHPTKFGIETQDEQRWMITTKEFDTLQSAQDFTQKQSITIERGGKISTIRIRRHQYGEESKSRKEYVVKDGYYVSTVYHVKNVKDLTSEDRLLRENVDPFKGKKRLTYPGKSNLKSFKLCSLFPFYKDMSSPRHEVKWLVQYYKDNNVK